MDDCEDGFEIYCRPEDAAGSYAPTLGKNIGLALVEAEYAAIGQQFMIEIRGKQVAAEVIFKPFITERGNNNEHS